ncbi:MAG: cation:proton antiporter, partial [Rhodospirillaceae bacterium]|nr:cation:proton antiporter [Rhodospirillaceae bacterium]
MIDLDPALPGFVLLIAILSALALAARLLRVPQVVGYLVAGVLVGRHGIGVVSDPAVMQRLGEVGVMLLLFHAGLDLSPRSLAARWRVALVGVGLQIALTTALTFGLGAVLGWPFSRSLLIGFTVSLSSTVVVLKLLEGWGEQRSRLGRDVLTMLVAQDLAVVPMLIVVGLADGDIDMSDAWRVLLQLAGAGLFAALALVLVARHAVRLPFRRAIEGERDLQVLLALLLCFGLALASALLRLSVAFGAFVAGMLVRALHETEWVADSLLGLRTVFIALFFVSIGLLIDTGFIARHWVETAALVLLVLVANTFINAVVLRTLGQPWALSVYGGSMMSQIGEFSFVLVSAGLGAGLITRADYQLAASVIALSLAASPLWIAAVRRATGLGRRPPSPPRPP